MQTGTATSLTLGTFINLWCNGNIQDFESCVLGSSPSRLT